MLEAAAAVVNFAPRKVADIISNRLTLAVDGEGGLVLLAVEPAVANGARVY